MARYEHQGGAKATSLSSKITPSATSFTVADATNWPTGSTNPFWVVIDRGKAAEEKILCSSRTGTLINVSSRGQDGTAAAEHEGGATVEHCISATEIDKFDAFVEDHGGAADPHPVYLTSAEGNAAYEPLKGTFRGVKAYRATSNQSIPNATTTAISLTGESYDSNTLHDNATNPSRFTIPAGLDGKWRFTAQIEFASNTTGGRQARLHKNGTMVARTVSAPGPSGYTTTMLVSVDLSLVAGDYIEAYAFHDAGAALDVVFGEATTWMSATYLGA